jgi:hypothetical protein
MEQFYIKHIPQSEYRKEKSPEKKKESSVIALELASLNIKDCEVKKTLVQKIRDEGLRVVKAAMPEDKWDEIAGGSCFAAIISKLGLK